MRAILIGLMPAHRAGDSALYSLKTICVFPDNPKRGLDAHQGTVTLFDGETGEVEALMNASAITAIRTAAVSAVATRLLAREDARDLDRADAGPPRRRLGAVLAEDDLRLSGQSEARPRRAPGHGDAFRRRDR